MLLQLPRTHLPRIYLCQVVGDLSRAALLLVIQDTNWHKTVAPVPVLPLGNSYRNSQGLPSLSHTTLQLPWVSSEWQQLVSGGYPSAGCLHVPSASTCWLSQCGSRGRGACTAYWSAPAEWVVHEFAVGMPARQIKELNCLANKRIWMITWRS